MFWPSLWYEIIDLDGSLKKMEESKENKTNINLLTCDYSYGGFMIKSWNW